ncbi:MAG: adenylate/guanylate cyclase domain-containing protein, partial [Myxococcota bacterium]
MSGEKVVGACGHANPPGARFCSTCGASLIPGCTTCGATLEPGAAFCSSCGAPTRPSAAAADPPIERAGERRHLTVLFCDLAGSTSLSARLDPENHKEVMEGYYDIVGGSVGENGGHINAYMGDGVLAFFGYPIARDDSTHRAVRTGLAIQQRIRERNAAGGIAGERIEARVGIHRGLVVIDEMGIDSGHGTYATGEAMNVAARVQDHANRGEVLVSEDVAQLVATAFKLEDRGSFELRGLAGERQLYLVTEETAHAAGPSTRGALVGREAEQELIRSRWASTLEDGQGQAVLVVGEPGIGKSRLVSEAAARLGGVRASHQAECSEYESHTPFALARSLLLERLGCIRGSTSEVVDEALGVLVESLGGDREEGHKLLSALLQSAAADDPAGRVLAPGEERTRLIEWLAVAFA